MNQLEFNRAMSYIDDDIVECFLNKKSKLENKIKFQKKSHSFLKWGAVAATFCLVFSVAWIFAGNANQKPNVPDEIVIDNTTENTTSEHIETNTQHIEATTDTSVEIETTYVEDTSDVNIENTTQNIELPTEDSTTNSTVDDFELPAPIDEIIWMKDNGSSDGEAVGGEWNGIWVSYDLYEVLAKSENDRYIAINIFGSDKNMENYVYEGKSYREHKDEYYSLINLSNKYKSLKKEGELLKFGELIYTEGLPDGTKWGKKYYDSQVAYYGEDVLNEFIVDGEFLSDKLEDEIFKIRNSISRKEKIFKEIHEPYQESMIPVILEAFKEYSVEYKNGRVFLFITPSELKNIDVENMDNYSLGLASRAVYEYDDREEIHDPVIKDIFVADVVTGFAYNKIYIKLRGGVASTPNSDEEVISMLNKTIDIWKYTHDSIEFYFYHDGSLIEDDFKGMNYSDVFIPKYQPREVVIVTVKYEDINIEAIRDISNMDEIYSIHISPPLVASPE